MDREKRDCKIVVYVTKREKDDVEKEAVKESESMSDIVRHMIREALRE